MNANSRTIDSLTNRQTQHNKYTGYLAFLPPSTQNSQTQPPFQISLAESSQAHYRHFYNRDFCWLEFKQQLPDTPLPFFIQSAERYLWLLIQFLGGGQIRIHPTFYSKEGRVYCYQPQQTSKELYLTPGKNWFFMLGIHESHWPALAEEFPLLQGIQQTAADHSEKESLIIGETSIQTKLMAALDALSRFEFRPFSLSFRLAAWNLRLFNLIFQDLKSEDRTSSQTEAMVELYHRATKYMQDNYRNEGINTEVIAKAMHVSTRKLHRSFENRPFTVMGYVQELRLLLARDILRDSNDSIASIAFDCHFVSDKHFTRLFKQRFGMSPNNYRIAMQGNVSFKYKRIHR